MIKNHRVMKKKPLRLKRTDFKFGSTICEQVKRTCMGTLMAPDYANLSGELEPVTKVAKYHFLIPPVPMLCKSCFFDTIKI